MAAAPGVPALTFAEQWRVAVGLLAGSFGADWRLRGELDAYVAEGGVTISLQLPPTFPGALLVVLIAVLSVAAEVRHRSRSTGELVIAALVDGAVLGAVVSLLAATGTGPLPFARLLPVDDLPLDVDGLAGLSAGPNLAATFASALAAGVVISIACRGAVAVRQGSLGRLQPHLSTLVVGCQNAGQVLLPGLVLVWCAAAVTTSLLARGVGTDVNPAVMLLLPAISVWGWAFVAGAPIVAEAGWSTSASALFEDDSDRSATSVGLLSGAQEISDTWQLLLLVPLVLAVVAGVAMAGQAPRRGVLLGQVLVTTLAGASVGGALAALTKVSGRGTADLSTFGESVSATGTASAGPSVLGAALAAAVWCLIGGVLGGLSYRFVAGCFPLGVAVVGRSLGAPVGARLHPHRARELADVRLAMGRGVPEWLERQAARPSDQQAVLSPLRARPGAGRAVLVTLAGAVVVAAVVGVLVTVVLTVVGPRLFGPQVTAVAYLDALSAGDAEAALAHLNDDGDASPLLTEDSLAAVVAAAPITGVAVTGAVSDVPGEAQVSVEYLAGEAPVTTTLQLVADPTQKRWGHWPVWRLTNGTATLWVDATGEATGIQVDGVRVPRLGEPVQVWPGAHTVSAVAGPGVVGTETVTAALAAGGYAEARVSARLDPRVVDQVSRGAEDVAARCVASTTFELPGCGVEADAWTAERGRGPSWRVLDVSVDVERVGSTLSATGGAELELTYTYTDWWTDAAETDTETFWLPLEGAVTVADGGEVSVTWRGVVPAGSPARTAGEPSTAPEPPAAAEDHAVEHLDVLREVDWANWSYDGLEGGGDLELVNGSTTIGDTASSSYDEWTIDTAAEESACIGLDDGVATAFVPMLHAEVRPAGNDGSVTESYARVLAAYQVDDEGSPRLVGTDRTPAGYTTGDDATATAFRFVCEGDRLEQYTWDTLAGGEYVDAPGATVQTMLVDAGRVTLLPARELDVPEFQDELATMPDATPVLVGADPSWWGLH